MTTALYVEHLQNPQNISSSLPPLVMLHGWKASSADLKPLAQLLSYYCEIILIDLPGFGQSPHPQAVWSSFEYAQRVKDYLHEKGITQVSILGHSFGGKVAMSFACLFPNHVQKLILIAASGVKRKRSLLEKCRLKTIIYVGKTLKISDFFFKTSFFNTHFVPHFGSADYKAAGTMRPILTKSVNEDLSEAISKIKTPTLLLWGEEDKETPPEIAYRLQKLITGSKLVMIPGKNHWLYQDVGHHLCAYHLLPFLQPTN